MDLKNKKILVTGSAGFLGQHLIVKLLARGVPRENIFAPSSKELDLRRAENCTAAVRGIDVIIHLAGITGNVELHRARPAEIFYDNLIIGVELMEVARCAGVKKFVAIGSASEYPENAPVPLIEENLWIGPPEENHASYVVAKKMLLVQAQAYRRQYNFNAVHLLLTNMYGPGEHPDGGPIPSFIIRVLEAKRSGARFVEAWGSGRPTRDFLYVEDATEGIVLAAEKYESDKPVNLGSGIEYSIKEIFELIARLTDFHGEIRWDTSKPDGQLRRVLNTVWADRSFGFKPRTNMEVGLKETIKHHGLKK